MAQGRTPFICLARLEACLCGSNSDVECALRVSATFGVLENKSSQVASLTYTTLVACMRRGLNENNNS
jgi:hypothetical protein